ncbi:LysE family translocator [Fibrobacter succinogenes]|jgi:threonine/homoserine/homoserine lactone efflux protein|uniref:Threonine/homoserine/homoserine lactone efflux protein n=1 Tax=Fibrobacter succinogenes TaxID=833 RepID=A0A380RW50_FIBSU|nr:LysE family translocator [Fibrobacter succinogenes]PWJ37546.1 threonine/homoserine/homoserine lactone efflux protein [Fibrobacter succinogenes subsp. elongatus]SUQ19793.1 Threonine/homoserine/homoserine lactone efflux protein [Fibrobacter succinogenes]
MLEFFIAALVIGIAPGPDNLFVLAQSATYGARLGFCIILGLCTGIAIHTCLLVAGVSALIAASPTAFFVIQCLGAAYLLYLAYKSFGVKAGVVHVDSCHPERSVTESKDPVKSSGVPSARSLYMRGIIMNLTNPKVILFVLSLIPPAVRLERPIHPSLQMAIFGGEFILATMIVFGCIALLAGTVKKFLLTSPKANRNLNWFSGAVFVFLAVALFFV